MFTIRPAVGGQPSLTLARLAFGFGAVDPTKAQVIAAMGRDEDQEVLAYANLDQRLFVQVVDRLFPGLVNREVLKQLLAQDDAVAGPDLPERLDRDQLRALVNAALAMLSPMIEGRSVRYRDAEDGPTEAKIVGFVKSTIDGQAMLRLGVEGHAESVFAGIDEIE